MSTLPVTVSATGVIPHKLHDVLTDLYLSDLLYVTIERSVIINTCNIFRVLLCDSTFQQSVINIFMFTFVIKCVRWCDSTVFNTGNERSNNNNNINNYKLKTKRENMHTNICGNTVDRNVVQKEAEKTLKCKSLCIEIQRIWILKCTIIPVIIGDTGIVTRSFRKNLEAVPGKHSIDSLQKTAILGTSHIIWKVLQCEA